MLMRPIPRTGEMLPVIGMGSWQAFDPQMSAAQRANLAELLQRYFAGGGHVIDSSPGHGRSETLLGEMLRQTGHVGDAFLAAKVRTTGRQAGEAQMQQSLRELGRTTLDLLQVHNLLDWHTHLPTLRAWKDVGRIRYLGVTHYATSAFDQVERIIREERVDFVQLPYSLHLRAAENRVLPAARDTGTAVLVMLPFEAGGLFAQLKGRALPGWAKDIGCSSWAQVFLKFALSHPAVTCVIPATTKSSHLDDNMQAGAGPIPDEAMRKRMVAELG